MSSLYEASESDVSRQPDKDGYGSLDKGIAGEYTFFIGEILSEAWERTRGAKRTLHLAMAIYSIIYLVTVLVIVAVATVLPSSVFVALPTQLILMAVSTPLWAGLLIIGLRRAVDAPIEAGQVLSCFRYTLSLFALRVVMTILMMLGFFLLILPGIYLVIAYILAIPLMADKNLGFWSALEASRKAVTRRWFSIFGLMLVLMFINFVAMIPLGLGLIWSAPMSIIAFGVLYRNIFGCSSQTVA